MHVTFEFFLFYIKNRERSHFYRITTQTVVLSLLVETSFLKYENIRMNRSILKLKGLYRRDLQYLRFPYSLIVQALKYKVENM